MLKRILNIARSLNPKEEINFKEENIIRDLKQKLNDFEETIHTLTVQANNYSKQVEKIEKESTILEREIEFLIKNKKRVESEQAVAKLSLLKSSYHQQNKIYQELISNITDLEYKKQNYQYRIEQYENKKAIIAAKTISAESELEIRKNLEELNENYGLKDLEDQLLEAECLSEAFEQINGESSPNPEKVTVDSFERKLKDKKKKEEYDRLEKIEAHMFGNSSSKEIRVAEIVKNFKTEKNRIEKESKSVLLEKWLKEQNDNKFDVSEEFDHFFSDEPKKNLIDKFFNT